MSISPPPARLPVSAPLRRLEPGRRLVRFFDPDRGPWHAQRFYGPIPDVRFDHHPPPPHVDPRRSVWYAATSLLGAVAEAFGRPGRFIDRAGNGRVALVRVAEPIRLVSLKHVDARIFGLTQEIGTATDYAACQAWARAFYAAYPEAEGILWRGRQSGSLCVLFHDRCTLRQRLVLEADRLIGDPAVWPRIARAALECRIPIV